ncbi:MAG: hypothetical protein MUO76_21420 [Anaerolineaceae bacterium]|nr:hypothetical protein [Anaerolineaceae bacterium]
MNKSLPRNILVKVLFIYFLLGGGEALFSLYQLLAIPGDPKHSLLFGFSAGRLTMAGFMMFVFFACVFLILYGIRKPSLYERFQSGVLERKNFLWLALLVSSIGFVGGLIGLNMDPVSTGRFANYMVRLQPIAIWITLASIQTIILLCVISPDLSSRVRKTGDWILYKMRASIPYLIWIWVLFILFLYWVDNRTPGLDWTVNSIKGVKSFMFEFFSAGYLE